MVAPVHAEPRAIESDSFPFEFLSKLGERESWRKEIHRPIYHVHKWWAKRLGSVFRGILLGSVLPDGADLEHEFYQQHDLVDVAVMDPFMGSGTTVGEAHKLGMRALGRDINPVAVRAVETALGPLDRERLLEVYGELEQGVGARLRDLYRSTDRRGRACDVLYYFWVMQARCPACCQPVDLFSSHVFAKHASPERKPQLQIHCPACGDIFEGRREQRDVECPACHECFDATTGTAAGSKATCRDCANVFKITDALDDTRPEYRLYAKLVLTGDGRKEYLRADDADLARYEECAGVLRTQLEAGEVRIPALTLAHGHNTRQAMNYNFTRWSDFFNDRQLLALAWLQQAIATIEDPPARRAFLTLFSGVLEFNNLFASYKGEGTGAVRHMFSHHILKPERMPIEANVWGTRKSSGAFSSLFRSRLLRAVAYRECPTEVNGRHLPPRACSAPFSGRLQSSWPTNGQLEARGIYLSTGDSARTGLPAATVDLVVTDPPFFDNVHYSELADFFFAWQQTEDSDGCSLSTRHGSEVQDADAQRFSEKLEGVLLECHRVLKPDGLLVFTYHHSRGDGWRALARSVLGAGFTFVNGHPVRAELSAATPKSQTKEPIQFDCILVCRKASATALARQPSLAMAMNAAASKEARLRNAGFELSRNDRRVVFYGQALASLRDLSELGELESVVEAEVRQPPVTIVVSECEAEPLLFEA